MPFYFPLLLPPILVMLLRDLNLEPLLVDLPLSLLSKMLVQVYLLSLLLSYPSVIERPV